MDLVDARRAREDFVVDDDGLGYHDDGEEYLGDEAGGDEVKTGGNKRQGRNALDEKVLKRARKLNRSAQQEGEEEEQGGEGGTMWNFVKKGGEGVVEEGGKKKGKGTKVRAERLNRGEGRGLLLL